MLPASGIIQVRSLSGLECLLKGGARQGAELTVINEFGYPKVHGKMDSYQTVRSLTTPRNSA